MVKADNNSYIQQYIPANNSGIYVRQRYWSNNWGDWTFNPRNIPQFLSSYPDLPSLASALGVPRRYSQTLSKDNPLEYTVSYGNLIMINYPYYGWYYLGSPAGGGLHAVQDNLTEHGISLSWSNDTLTISTSSTTSSYGLSILIV